MPRRRLERRAGHALLVGEAPARVANRAALDGPAGDRLAGYAGMDSRRELLDRFDAVNLLGRWPGSCGKGSAWPLARARRAAARLPLRGVVVLLGGRVAAAYGVEPAWGEWRELASGRALVCVVPHPSGVNRLLNDAAAREMVGRRLLEAEVLALHASYSGAILSGIPDPVS